MILLLACADPPPPPARPEPPPPDPAGTAPSSPASPAPPPAVVALPDDVRERVPVVVGGKPETWEIRWTGPRTIECWADTTCPCDPFGIAEAGPAVLVRLRDGQEIERFDLAQAFNAAQDASGTSPVMLGRARGTNADEDIPEAERAAELARRPATKVLELQDYDHDGQDAEALLPIEAGPCGHTTAVLMGLGPDGHLQLRRTPEHPERPLVLDNAAWGSLLTGSGENVTVRCGDHGSDVEWTARLWAADGQIHAEQRSYSCTEAGERGAQVSEETL